MADLHQALTNNPFRWFPWNILVGQDRMPVNPNEVPKIPEAFKISLNVKAENGKEKEVGFYVNPCSGENVEEFLSLTWDQYSKGCNAKLPENLREDGPTHFRFFPQCLRVTATTLWTKVLEDNGVNAIDEEEIAGITHLGDAIIRFLCHGKKPGLMAPDACFRHRKTLMAYFDSGLLCSKLARPTAYQLAEAVFLSMPRTHQEKYAETQKPTFVTAPSTSSRVPASVLPPTTTRIRARADARIVARPSATAAEDETVAIEATIAVTRAVTVATATQAMVAIATMATAAVEIAKATAVTRATATARMGQGSCPSRQRGRLSWTLSFAQEVQPLSLEVEVNRDPNIPQDPRYSDEEQSKHESYFGARSRQFKSFLNRNARKCRLTLQLCCVMAAKPTLIIT
eukprot:scaffold54040_cov37-Cyclotella_meneghiniana.AAC.1